MNRILLLISVAALGACQPTMALATVIIDNSPDAIGAPIPGFTAQNQSSYQNFLATFTLSQAATIGGIDIYSDSGPILGTAVTIKLRNDVSGTPSAANDYSFASVLNAIDSTGSTANPTIQRLHANFTATALAAGTYWIGMSGTSSEIGWNLQFGAPGPDVWQLSGNNLQFDFEESAAFAFRVDDGAAPSPTPEPATWAMMVGGFGLIGSVVRGRKRTKILFG